MGSLAGILNLPKLEQVFAQLVNRMAAQEAEISRLRIAVESGVAPRSVLNPISTYVQRPIPTL